MCVCVCVQDMVRKLHLSLWNCGSMNSSFLHLYQETVPRSFCSWPFFGRVDSTMKTLLFLAHDNLYCAVALMMWLRGIMRKEAAGPRDFGNAWHLFGPNTCIMTINGCSDSVRKLTLKSIEITFILLSIDVSDYMRFFKFCPCRHMLA